MTPRFLARQAIRAAQSASTRSFRPFLHTSLRKNSTNDNSKLPVNDVPGPGPNSESLGHVSEEAAEMGKITGDPSAPDLSEGTPVQEVLNRDPVAKEKAPEVLKDAMDKKSPSGTRSYSTMIQREPEQDKFFKEINAETEYINMPGAEHAQLIPPEGSEPKSYLTQMERWQGKAEPRTKFGMPDNSKIISMRKRYDDIISQMANLMIKDGKKSKAESNVVRILNNLKISKPPVFSSTRSLLPGHPPASHLPLNPVLYLSLAVDSVAPLVRMRAIKGAAGGGRALIVPVALPIRTRRRIAIEWILDAASKKPFRGSGKGGLAQRITEEIIAIVEGKSGIWQKRTEVHKQGVLARSNLKQQRRR